MDDGWQDGIDHLKDIKSVSQPPNKVTYLNESIDSKIRILETDNTVSDNDEAVNVLNNDDDFIDTIQSTEESRRSESSSKEIVKLQAYKLHLPMKYLTKNNTQYLRTKVFGFALINESGEMDDSDATSFTCCICRETMRKENVIGHSKWHYPLKPTDSCQICYFGFNTIDCLRNHLKNHTVFIDEKYNEQASNVDVTGSSNKFDTDNMYNWDSNDTLNDRTPDESDETKSKSDKNDIFICEFCGMIYNSKRIFLQHVRKIHLSPFLCKFCRKRFSNKTSMKHHRCILVVEKGPNEKVSWFNCKCKKIFLFEAQYLKHMETCEKSKLLTCQDCGRMFSDKAKLDLHILFQHIKLKELEQKTMSVWICEICGCHLSRLSAKKHYLTHLFMEKKFTCEKCDMKFIDKIALDRHTQTHSDLRPFSCDICKATFKRKDHVKMHMKNKHNISDNNSRKYHCRKCKRDFTTNSYLIRHQRLHSQGVSYECATCKSRFPTEHSLKMHQTRTKHDSTKDKSGASVSLSTADWVNRHRCNVCNQRYGSITSLKKHALVHMKTGNKKEEAENNKQENMDGKDGGNNQNDETEDIFQCTKCSKRYLSEFGLKLHLTRTKHGPVNLKAKKKLKTSSVQVSSEKNARFKCNVCNDNFRALLNLKMHKIKCKHFSKCPNCDKRFALDYKLRNHLIKVHNKKDVDEVTEFTSAEIRPFECGVCLRKFAMNHNLVAHMQMKHADTNGETGDPVNVIYVESDLLNEKTADDYDTPVVYHCTDCWKNFYTEEEFRTHNHDAKMDHPSEDMALAKTITIDFIPKETDGGAEITITAKND